MKEGARFDRTYRSTWETADSFNDAETIAECRAQKAKADYLDEDAATDLFGRMDMYQNRPRRTTKPTTRKGRKEVR